MAGIVIELDTTTDDPNAESLPYDANDDIIGNVPNLRYWFSGHIGVANSVVKDRLARTEFTKGYSTKTFPALATPATFDSKTVFDFGAATTAALMPSNPAVKVSPNSYTLMLLLEWTNAMAAAARIIAQTRVGLVSGDFGMLIQKSGAGNIEFYPNFTGASGQRVLLADSFTPGTPVFLAFTYDFATKYMAIYRNDLTAPASAATSSGANVANDRYLIFGNSSGNAASMYLAEPIYADRVLSASEMTKIQAAWVAKYGL